MGKPLRGGVLGHPIAHSKSPALHRAAYGLMGVNYAYDAYDVQVPELAGFLDRVRAEGDWYGLSVTMPLKNAALELVDTLTPLARTLGAVNTVIVTRNDDGGAHLSGDNTDVAGIVNALAHAGAAHGPRAAVLGGGGTAVSALAALAEMAASSVDVFVRTPAKAADTLALAETLGLTARLRPFGEAAAALAGYDVVISTLPPRGADPLAGEFLAGGAAVTGAVLLDVAYDPWPSALAAAWESRGGSIVPGIEMLLYQGVEQAKHFMVAGGHGAPTGGQVGDVINVMCDSLGLARR